MPKTYRDGDNATYYSTDLVVALEHVDEVERTLRDLDVGFGGIERSDLLGLALVPDIDDESAAGKVRAALTGELQALGRPEPAAPWGREQTPPTMDGFLWGLRQYFATRNAGWTPTIGKNRHVARVVGAGGGLDGKISHGGGSAPRAVATPEWASEVRPAEPGRGVRVGVLDTSIFGQPWLAGGWVAPAADVLAANAPYEAAAGHATFVAGLVLRQAPGATVVARQVLSDKGVADSWSVAEEIVRLGRTGVDVLNLSFLCYTEDGRPPMLLATAIDRLGSDVLVVAAAGNHGDLEDGPDARRKPAWPAALDHVVAVGATDDKGQVSSFTPKDVPWIDVHVPGKDVVSTYLKGDVELTENGTTTTRSFGGYASWSGTSFAAASLSGAVAAGTEPGRVSAHEAWSRLCPPTRPAPFLRLDP
jgi:membrane-anchored mycosin MYCP